MKIPRSLTVLLLSGYFICSNLPVVAQTTTTVEKTTTVNDEPLLPGSTVTRTTTVEPAFPGSTVERTTTVQSGLPGSTVERTTTVQSGLPGSTVERTTTVENGIPVTTRMIIPQGLFVPSDSYIVVDPLTGSLQGNFDIATGFFNGRPLTSGYVVVDKFTGKVIATSDSSGRIIEISSVPATAALLAAIDSRRAEIDHLITNSLASGQISSQTATYLRGQLDRIAADELIAAQTGGVITYAKALDMANALTLLQSEFPSVIVTSSISRPVIGGHFVEVNGQLLMPNDIEYRRVALMRLIDDQYKAGRLVQGQVDRLQEKLNDISLLEAKYTRKGELSESKASVLSAKLDIIKSDMGQDIATTNAKRASMGLVVY